MRKDQKVKDSFGDMQMQHCYQKLLDYFEARGRISWGCVSAAGTGNLHFIEDKMDKFQYIDILKQHVKPSCQKLGISNNFTFYQANDPKHKSYVVIS